MTKGMSRSVQMHEIAFSAQDIGNHGNPVHRPGSTRDLISFAVGIDTDDGSRGGYAFL